MEITSLTILISLMFSTFVSFLMSGYAKIDLSWIVFAFLLVVSCSSAFLILSRYRKEIKLTQLRPNFWERFIRIVSILLIGFNVSVNLLLNVYWPPTDFDALAMYDFRGRVISKENSIKNITGGYEGSYPMFTSMFHAFAYEFGLENPKFIYTIIFVCLIISFTALVSRLTNPTLGILSGLILSTTPILYDHAAIAYTNLSFTAYFGLGVTYLASYTISRLSFDGIVGSILLGSSAWIRAATLPYVITIWIIVLLLSVKKRKKLSPIFLLPFFYLFFEGLWRYYQVKILGVVGYEQQGIAALLKLENIEIFPRLIPETISSLLNNFLNPEISGATGYLFIGIVLIYIMRIVMLKKQFIRTSTGLIFSLFLLVNWVVVALSIFSYSKNLELWRALVHDSMQRVYISFLPIFVFSSVMLIFEISRTQSLKPHEEKN